MQGSAFVVVSVKNSISCLSKVGCNTTKRERKGRSLFVQQWNAIDPIILEFRVRTTNNNNNNSKAVGSILLNVSNCVLKCTGSQWLGLTAVTVMALCCRPERWSFLLLCITNSIKQYKQWMLKKSLFQIPNTLKACIRGLAKPKCTTQLIVATYHYYWSNEPIKIAIWKL